MKEPVEDEVSPKAANVAAFASACTLHGINHVFLPGPLTPRRVAWAAAVLAALGIFLYQVADRVQYYRQYHHVTKLDEEDEKRLIFPAVTFCNYNRVRRSRLTRNDLHWLGRELLGVEAPNQLLYFQALGQPESEASLAGFFPSRSFDMQEFFRRTGHSLEDMILACHFRTRECGPENFTTVSPPVAFAVLTLLPRWPHFTCSCLP